MPVDSEMFHQLSAVYKNYAEAGDPDTFLKKERRRIKILTDSLWEQTVINLFSVTPRNYTDARAILNREKHRLTSVHDLAVAEAMLAVLQNYEVLIEKSYIDIAAKVKPMFTVTLRRLCLNLADHPSHMAYGYAVRLSQLLGKHH